MHKRTRWWTVAAAGLAALVIAAVYWVSATTDVR